MLIVTLLRRLFDPEYLVPPEKRTGPLPSARDAYSVTVQMAWPAVTESVLVCLVGVVDNIMVSRLGSAAIAATGLTNQPRMILLALFMALTHGVTAVVSRRRGQEDRAGANRCLRQVLLLAAVAVVAVVVLMQPFSRGLLHFAGAQEDTIDLAVTYFRIMILGIPAVVLNMVINAAQRGAGNTRIAMKTNLSANVVNCIGNYLLIEGHLGFPALGVAGAAIATVIGNYVGLAIAIASLSHRDNFLYVRLTDSFRPDMETLRSVMKVSGSAALEQLFIRVGFFLYAKIVAELGTDDFATHNICMNVLSLSYCFGDGLTMAASALVGQSLGRRRPDVAILYGRCAQRIGALISLCIVIICLTLNVPIMRLFTQDPYIIEKGSFLIMLSSIIITTQISQVVYSGCLRGAGDTLFVAMVSMLSISIVRTGSSWLFCYPLGLGLYGAWYGIVFDQILRLILNGKRFSDGKWTKIEV